MAVRHNRVEYTTRAFGQDAEAAMRGDIVRALVELLTNSDDAYRGSHGRIFVTIAKTDPARYGLERAEKHPLTVSVQDSAGGLSPQDMERHFGKLGGQNEGIDTLFITGGIVADRFGPDSANPDNGLLEAWLEEEGLAPTHAMAHLG